MMLAKHRFAARVVGEAVSVGAAARASHAAHCHVHHGVAVVFGVGERPVAFDLDVRAHLAVFVGDQPALAARLVVADQHPAVDAQPPRLRSGCSVHAVAPLGFCVLPVAVVAASSSSRHRGHLSSISTVASAAPHPWHQENPSGSG